MTEAGGENPSFEPGHETAPEAAGIQPPVSASDSPRYDVIVIGAGVSGLTAARQLLQRQPDVSLLVLEATGRVGGRTLTVPLRVAGGREELFDLGGQWVGTAQTEVMELIRELGLSIFPQYTTGKKLMHVDNKIRHHRTTTPNLGSLRGLLELELFSRRIDRLATKCFKKSQSREKLLHHLDGYTLDAYARKHMTNHNAIESFHANCRSMFGCDASQIALTWFLFNVSASGGLEAMLEATPGCAQEYIISGGAQQISEKLALLIGSDRIVLNEPITRIEQTDTQVQVHSADAVYESRYVISSVPPNQLLRIQLTPPLSAEKRCIIENMPMGNMIKVILTYEQAFWRSAGLSGEVVSSSGPLCVVFDATTERGSAALVGLIAGGAAEQYRHASAADRRQAVLHSLQQLFGAAAGRCIQYAERVWADEPFTGGCPLCFTAPGLARHYPLLSRRHRRLLFCGTETASHCPGYICGAVQSGRQAADETLPLIRCGAPRLAQKA